uniref:ribosomal protein S20 n=1 Tax=Haramonas pauciplastida TaxID=478668 RepID=UPI00211488F0|nr:ribosomal protein S20 [Haramonas pauciplastida]UTE95007.1 ribosomal protein S20 [Haramonas pauciplastida]
MPTSKSVLKRIRVNRRNQKQNRFYKSAIKSAIKKAVKHSLIYINEDRYVGYPDVITRSVSLEIADILLSRVYAKVDKAVQKKVIHKNTGARIKKKTVRRLNLVELVIK